MTEGGIALEAVKVIPRGEELLILTMRILRLKISQRWDEEFSTYFRTLLSFEQNHQAIKNPR